MTVDVPDDALAIRGGDPHDPERFKGMLEQAQLAYDRGLGYALSTYMGDDHSLGRNALIAQMAAVRPIPNRLLAPTTARQLREIDCELVPDGHLPCHVRVILGSKPDPTRVEEFIGVFGPAEENPVYQATRRAP